MGLQISEGRIRRTERRHRQSGERADVCLTEVQNEQGQKIEV